MSNKVYKLFVIFTIFFSFIQSYALENKSLNTTEQVFVKTIEQESQKLFSPDSASKPFITIKLQKLIDEMSALHQEGLLDGEFLVAKGSQVLVDLRSADVSKVAKVNGGGPQFMIGSVSKQFFAVALLKALYDHTTAGGSESEKAADVKRLLHLPLSHFLKEDAALWNGAMPDWANEITLHHLLSHTSGIKNNSDCDECYTKNISGKKLYEIPYSTKQIMKIVLKYPVNFTPGSKYSYSNTGYLLIAEVISTITGKPASSYVTEALFDPLGLSSTSAPEIGNEVQLRKFDPCCSRLVPQWGYDPAATDPLFLNPPYELVDMSWVQGAGSVISTASDLLKWNVALHQKKSVLPLSLYKLFITENLNEYAYGIGRWGFYGGLVLEHSGLINNYISHVFYLPDHELSIIHLSNVCVESPQITKEINQLMVKLKDQIPDESERRLAVKKKLKEKYPSYSRGVVRRKEILKSFFIE